jgi:hypothetical protein
MKRAAKKAARPRESHSGVVQVRLPFHLIGYVTRVSEMAGVSIQDVINVMVASRLIAERGGNSATANHG